MHFQRYICPRSPTKGLSWRSHQGVSTKQPRGRKERRALQLFPVPAQPQRCESQSSWDLFTLTLRFPTLDAQGQPAYGAISATFLHNTWNARWRFQKTFGQGQGDIFGRLLPESRSGETSVRGVPGKPRPEPGGTGTLVLTMDPRWRLEGFSRCPAFHKPTLAWGLWGCSTPDHHLWESKPSPEPCSGTISLDLWDGSAVLTASLSIWRILGWQRAQKMLLHLWNAS